MEDKKYFALISREISWWTKSVMKQTKCGSGHSNKQRAWCHPIILFYGYRMPEGLVVEVGKCTVAVVSFHQTCFASMVSGLDSGSSVRSVIVPDCDRRRALIDPISQLRPAFLDSSYLSTTLTRMLSG
jgi:hypothetical protein